MARKGPLPKPGSHDTLRGRNTFYRQTPAPPIVPVDPPDLVLANEVALAFWNRHAASLVEARRLTPVQADSFGMLCLLDADIRDLTATVAATGHVVDTPKGPAPNPAANMLRYARRDFVTLAKEFGMTAMADARIPQDQESAKTEDADEAALRYFTGTDG